MDSLIKQARVRFAADQTPPPPRESSFKKDRKIIPRKSVSFKEDKKQKNRLSSLRRTFSDRMKYDDVTGDGEFEVAVAAAAYAVSSSLAEDGLRRKKTKKKKKQPPVEEAEAVTKIKTRSKSFREDSATKNKSFKEDNDTGRISRWFSGIYPKEDGSSVAAENGGGDDLKSPEKITSMKNPSFKNKPTLSERYMNELESKKHENEIKNKNSNPLSAPKPTVPAAGDIDLSRKPPQKKPTKADAWEIAQNEKIMKRYKKMYATILEWENEKKKKAKRKLDKKKRLMELSRAKTLQKYRNDIARIDKVAGGARALAEERRRNDESKLIEKARQVRMRGNRKTCFGF